MLDDVKNTPVTYPESKYPPDGKAPVAFGIPAWLCVPASASPTSAQFRKNLWPLRNYRPELGFWGCRKSFRNWAPEGDNEAGQFNTAGLPNIMGDVYANSGSWTFSGAFFTTSGTGSAKGVSSSDTSVKNKFSIDASKSNPIYGGSHTVMPPSINQPVILYLGRSS